MWWGAKPFWRGWRDVAIDVVPAVGLWGAGLLDMAYGLSDAVGDASPASSFFPMTAVCLLLVLRRHRPFAVLCAVVLVIAVPIWFLPLSLGYWGEFIPWLVALYSCARHEGRIALRAAGAGVSAATLAVIAIRFPEMADPGDMLYDGALLAGSWVLGLFARSWSRYRDDALRRDVEQAQAEERAVVAERSRIARELHDVISHTITVIVMQAGGARLAAQSDPAVAVAALGRIERLGQDSLGELRTLLAVLGGAEDGSHAAGAAAPQPTLADIPELCERMRGLGLPVSLGLSDAIDGVPAGVQLAGFRVVQEGLTNVLKHAGPVRTRVRVRRERHGLLRLQVCNEPGRPAGSVPSGQHGLMGLRERVAALGGAFSAGPLPDGGFAVSADLPAGGAERRAEEPVRPVGEHR